ncbi:MAG: SPASM domain-containing protein [Spirochaetales bacterium]|nr:SPASM domain-containing protein [Spirochaetales bacterium]
MRSDQQEYVVLESVASAQPRFVYLESTDRCNARCLHCYHYHRTFGMDMQKQVMRKAIDALSESVEMIVPQGMGEPLIADSFYDIVEAFKGKAVRFVLVTNAIMLRDERLVRRLVRSPINIGISIDGVRPETFGFVRPQPGWKRLLEALALVQLCRREAGPECRATMSLNCVAMKETIPELPDLVRMAHAYGAWAVFVCALSGDNGVEKLRGQSPFEAPEAAVPALLEAMAVSREFGVELFAPPSFHDMVRESARADGDSWRAGLSPPARHILGQYARRSAGGGDADRPRAGRGFGSCKQPWEWTFIASNGAVRACCMPGPNLGDLNAEDWGKIWNSPRYRSFRRLTRGWNPPAICRACHMPDGINEGDNNRYAAFFGRFRAEPVDVGGDGAEFGGGFQRMKDGDGKTAWRLKNGVGTIRIPKTSGARFLGFAIKSAGQYDLSPAECVVNDGPPEPFDLSCDRVHFPVDHVEAEFLDVRVEMEDGGASGLVVREAFILH